MIKDGSFIKHKNFKDICILVKSSILIDGELFVIGSHWNLGAVNSYEMNIDFFHGITENNLKDWLKLEIEEITDDLFLRNYEWSSL